MSCSPEYSGGGFSIGYDYAAAAQAAMMAYMNAVTRQISIQLAQIAGGRQQSDESNCPAVPSLGPGRDVLNRNIKRARAARMNASGRDPTPGGTLVDLVGQSYLVVTSQNYKANPLYRGSAPYGNFNFGATFAARGFSLEQALGFSDTFQRLTTGRADPAEDVVDVTNGFNYATRGCDTQ